MTFVKDGKKFVRAACGNLVKVETKGGDGIGAKTRRSLRSTGKPVVSTHMLNDMAAQNNLFAFHTAREIADRAVASDTVVTKYDRLAMAYDAWQHRRRLDGNDMLIHLPTEMAAIGLLCRYLDLHALRVDSGDKRAEQDPRINNQRPCDLLMWHLINAGAALADEGQCGLDIGEKTRLIYPPNIDFVARTALRNCCLEQVVSQFSAAVKHVMPEYVPVEPERIRSHLRPAERLGTFLREARS